jgi:hypothetical protein
MIPNSALKDLYYDGRLISNQVQFVGQMRRWIQLTRRRVLAHFQRDLLCEVAQTCFQRPNLSYCAELIKEGVLAGDFDLVVLMVTYEHIALGDRAALHATIRSLLAGEARLVLTLSYAGSAELRAHKRSVRTSACG